MAYVSAADNATLLDITKRLNPDGSVAVDMAEMLHEQNEILADMPWAEGNLTTGHRHVVRTGLARATWRKYNEFVGRAKTTSITVDDTCAMLRLYGEVDAELLELSGNPETYLKSEATGIMEGINQQFVETLLYGNAAVNPNQFTGLAPRFNSLSGENASNIVVGSHTSAGADQTSIWLLVWSPRTIWGIYPKGSVAGLHMEDKGRQTLTSENGSMEIYRQYYKWDCGLAMKDWRFAVRIPNIDVGALTNDASTGADLIQRMTIALDIPPSLMAGKAVFYCNRTILSYLRLQAIEKRINTLEMSDIAGQPMVSFGGVPVRRVDQILNTEAIVT